MASTNKLENFDLKTLAIFADAISLRSIARSAQYHHIVASAASKRISLLERRLNVTLLDRNTRGVEPTPAGEALYDYVSHLSADLQRASDDLSWYANGIRGCVNIRANLTAVVYYLPSALKAFSDANPFVHIKLSEAYSAQVVQAIADGSDDVGICSVAPDPRLNLDVFHYATDELVVVTTSQSHFAKRPNVHFSEIVNEKIISLSVGTSIYNLCESAAAELKLPFKTVINVTNFEAMRNMICSELGIGILPLISIAPYLRATGLRAIPIADSWGHRTLNIVVRAFDRLSAPSKLFVDHLTHNCHRYGG